MPIKIDNYNKEIIFADRIIIINCITRNEKKSCDNFFNIMRFIEEKISKLMDSCGIPEQIILNFKKGDKTLSAMYYVNSKEISRHLIVIDIYTSPLKEMSEKEKDFELIHSFVHELIHHKYKDEKKTDEMTKKYLKENLDI